MGRKRRRIERDEDDDAPPKCGDVDESGRLYCTCHRCHNGKWVGRSTYYTPLHANARPAENEAGQSATGSANASADEQTQGALEQEHRSSPELRMHMHDENEQLWDFDDVQHTPPPRRSTSPPADPPADPPSRTTSPERQPTPLPNLRGGIPQPDPAQEEEEREDDTPALRPQLHDLDITQQFIDGLRNASHANGDLNEEQLADLLNPSDELIDLDSHENRITRHCIRTFLATRNGSDDSYTKIIASSRETYPDDADLYLSLAQVKRRIARVSGVYAIETDMCPKSCIAFTGPFADLDQCPNCDTARYDARGKAVQTFDTILLGPQIQALRRHPDRARAMRYFMERVRALLALRQQDGKLSEFDDIVCGDAILDAVRDEKIGDDDTILVMSMDGAQLYRNKTSDCWIVMWGLLNVDPKYRYKQQWLIPATFIRGKPKHVDSFLYPSLHHIAAINNAGGLHVYDASRRLTYQSILRILLALADGVAAVLFSGLVPHHGKFGCRLYCGTPGRHKPGGSHYYPALLKPDNYVMAGCDHADICQGDAD